MAKQYRLHWRNQRGYTGHGELMAKQYRLHWRNQRGYTGHGEPLDDREMLEGWVEKLAKEAPDLTHWIEEES